MQFESQKHERVFQQLIRGLRGLGYKGTLIQEDYSFPDLFLPGAPVRLLPAAAFGREPPSYDSACIAIVIPHQKAGVELVSEYRALGAPVALEVGHDHLTQWRVSADVDRIVRWDEFHPDDLPRKLREKKDEWSPDTIVRGKNVFAKLAPRQLDFIDLGLIPALERQVRDKLDYLLRKVISSAVTTYKNSTGREPDMHQLFRLVFRFVAAKLLSDRRVPSFRSVDVESDPETILTRVSRYYKQSEPIIEDMKTRITVAQEIWSAVSFQNLSVESLAYIYENTLVDEQLRRALGTHSTPASVARYVVSRLIDEQTSSHSIQIVEPCSGHAIFLVAALERLRDLLPSDLDPEERHQLFVKALRGFERDPFALEVGKLCLMLADFPFPNGWHLFPADVFASPELESALTRADIVLCNPPFGNFSRDERQRYAGLRSMQKPAELLHRVLGRLKPSGTLGFVLPRQFTDGRAYRDIRRQLADRYECLEVVSLPDRIFHVSQIETSLLIGRVPSTRHTQVNLSFSHVSEADTNRFLQDYEVSYRDSGQKTKAAFASSAGIPPLGAVWEQLAESQELADVASVHRGVEWRPPFDEAKYISVRPKKGFAKGLRKVTDDYMAFQTPAAVYLSIRSEDQRTEAKAFDLPWEKPKVIANAATLQRGPWRIAAFPDDQGLVCTQRFFGIWPLSDWTIETLSAVLNGPIANAYISAHENKRDNRKSTLERIPLPLLTEAQRTHLDQLVEKYRGIAGTVDMFDAAQASTAHEGILRTICLEIDAIVLRGYGLPPRIERQLLDFFRGHRRRVPFPFTEYFPAEFAPTIPLWMYISSDFQRCRADYLISRLPQVTDPALVDALAEVE